MSVWSQLCSVSLWTHNLTRSTRRMQASLAKVEHYCHMNPYFAKEVMNVQPLWWKANIKGSGSLPAPRSDHTTGFFAHLLISEDLDHHQNLISSLYHLGPLHKISSKSDHNFVSNVVHKETSKQTDRQTNMTKSITFFCQGGNYQCFHIHLSLKIIANWYFVSAIQ